MGLVVLVVMSQSFLPLCYPCCMVATQSCHCGCCCYCPCPSYGPGGPHHHIPIAVVVLRNLSAFTISPTFSSLLTPNCISPLMNSLPHWTSTGTFPNSPPMPRFLRRNSVPVIDVLLCFTFLVSDLSHSSTGPLVHWFPFLSHMFSSLDSAAAPPPLCSTSSPLHFSFRLSLLQSLVDTLSYDFSLSLYDILFPFLLGPCASLYSI